MSFLSDPALFISMKSSFDGDATDPDLDKLLCFGSQMFCRYFQISANPFDFTRAPFLLCSRMPCECISFARMRTLSMTRQLNLLY